MTEALTLIAVLAKAVSASEDIGLSAGVATASVAECLLRLVGLQLANDVSVLKQYMMTRAAAKATAAEADARRLMAEALQAENRATLAIREDRLARIERRKLSAEVLKLEAEARQAVAEAAIKHAEAAVVKVQSDFVTNVVMQADTDEVTRRLADFKQAVRRLNAKGGGIFVDQDELKRLLADK